MSNAEEFAEHRAATHHQPSLQQKRFEKDRWDHAEKTVKDVEGRSRSQAHPVERQGTGSAEKVDIQLISHALGKAMRAWTSSVDRMQDYLDCNKVSIVEPISYVNVQECASMYM